METLNNLADYQMIFGNIIPTTFNKKSRPIFETLKPFLATSIVEIILKRKRLNRGPKPKIDIIYKFLDAYFEAVDNGSKIEYLERHYDIFRATYYRYLNLLIDYKLIEQYHEKLLTGAISPTIEMTDASHIRSVDGSEGVDFGYKEKGKRALKITIISGINKVIYHTGIAPDNLPDHKALEQLIDINSRDLSKPVLADSGYNGEDFKEFCGAKGYRIISVPRKYRNGEYSHTLSNQDDADIKTYRSGVEHNFASLKRFLAIQVKRTKLLKTFNSYLQLATLLVCIQNGILNGGLENKKPFKLRRKN